MLFSLTYSIIQCLRGVNELQDVVWRYDGVELTGREKPFATVEQITMTSDVLSKERVYVQEEYLFQVGLFANTARERAVVGEKLKTALRNPRIHFYDAEDESGSPKVAGYFYADVLAENVLPQEDVSDETSTHRVYYDVQVVLHRENGANQYQQ